MLQSIRRVVTGHDSEGRSIVLSDESADATAAELPFWPGRGSTAIWTTPTGPASNREEDLPRQITGFPLPGSGGVALMFMELPPDSELESMPEEQRSLASSPVARLFPEAYEIDTSKSFQMHATDTVDFVVLLSGEVTLLVDEGEVVLKPFDVVIQRGVNHGWVNRGTTPALIAAAVIDAVPLDRRRSGPKGVDVAT
ncbi:cupin domain-containing protein [Streptomyces muensis]|uniref:Cupin domain-containing protein n=1 Tax=Streptomyces muensis TaxID=1077944 RepID=A0A9X1PUK6_STRM4|nr:cupin domain-containing protein [Streptomyces muensis]MCF1592544.1 cupin domain-containing protein [Streptomyces muensis]